MTLKGKVALVTGGSRGIGRAIVERLSHDGAAVAINYARRADDAKKLASEIESSGGEAFAIQADVGRFPKSSDFSMKRSPDSGKWIFW